MEIDSPVADYSVETPPTETPAITNSAQDNLATELRLQSGIQPEEDTEEETDNPEINRETWTPNRSSEALAKERASKSTTLYILKKN